jgi:hypothetical protein
MQSRRGAGRKVTGRVGREEEEVGRRLSQEEKTREGRK